MLIAMLLVVGIAAVAAGVPWHAEPPPAPEVAEIAEIADLQEEIDDGKMRIDPSASEEPVPYPGDQR